MEADRALPFTAALERFDPSAEPYANMTPGRLEQAKADRLRKKDLAGYWEADLHLAEKTPPLERYIHDLGVATHGWLMIMERKGLLPREGWTHRHLVAVWCMAHMLARRPELAPFLPLTPAESRALADDTGIQLAEAIQRDPSEVEWLQAQLERDEGGPLVAPG